VRVGDHGFDNVMDGGLSVDAEERESADWLLAPDDLDPAALRVALWKLTEIKLDEACEDYYDHQKAMVSEYLRDETAAFTRERPVTHIETLHEEPFPRARWASMLVELSRRFLQCPEVYDPWVGLRAERVHRWLCTSEGTRVITEDVYVEAVAQGFVLTEDGVYVQGERSLYLRSLDDVPGRAEMGHLVEETLEELEQLRRAQSPGSFIGPALL
jgi:hypothetical protein